MGEVHSRPVGYRYIAVVQRDGRDRKYTLSHFRVDRSVCGSKEPHQEGESRRLDV